MKQINPKTIFRFLIGGSEQFQKNFLSLASANAVAQLVAVGSLPIMTRIFSPADFAILAIFTAYQGFAVAVATGRVEWLVPTAHNRGQAVALIGLGMVICAGVCLIILAACGFFLVQIADYVGLDTSYSNVLFLLPLGVLGGGIQLIFQAWHTRKGDLSIVSFSKVSQSVITLVTSIAGGLVGFGAVGLISSYVMGVYAAAGMLLLNERFLLGNLAKLRVNKIFAVFRKTYTQIGMLLAIAIVNTLVSISTTILISLYYAPEVVGWYSLAFRLGAAPATLFTMALAYSYWARGAELVKTDPAELRRFYLNSIVRLSVPGVLMSLVFIAGPLYVDVIFGGAEWDGAGALLAASTPFLFALIVLSPSTHLVIYGKQSWQLACDSFTLVAMWIVFGLAASQGAEAWVAVLCASLTLLFGYILRALAYLKANSLLQAERNAMASALGESKSNRLMS
jgi:O-antigen/teichoic acid export membrane protein